MQGAKNLGKGRDTILPGVILVAVRDILAAVWASFWQFI